MLLHPACHAVLTVKVGAHLRCAGGLRVRLRTLTAALRSYDQLLKLVQTRRGLEIIIDAASSLFDQRSLQRLAEGVLTQLASLMAVECAGILVLREADGELGLSVLAGSGCYRHYAAETGETRKTSMVPIRTSRTMERAAKVMARCWRSSTMTAGAK